jgi:steroid delta-isomerase-like uncharacterized protein
VSKSFLILFLAAGTTLGLLLAGCATPTSPAGGEADAAGNNKIIQRYFNDWANHGDARVADQLIATNVVVHHPQASATGLDVYKQSMAMFHGAFPDLHFAIEDQVAAGDRVVVRWTMTGTQRGAYQGQAPSGRKVAVVGVSLFRLAAGRVQEIWVSMDRLGFMQQLGMLPTPK